MHKTKHKLDCYFCCQTISNLKQHIDKYVGRKSTGSKCNKKGHIADVCCCIYRWYKHEEGTAFDTEEQMYNVNLFQITPMQQSKKPTLQSNIQQKNDFKVQVVANNHLQYVIADTGARVSVCDTTPAKKWDLIDPMVPSQTKIKTYMHRNIWIKLSSGRMAYTIRLL